MFKKRKIFLKNYTINTIATIHTDFPSKFGIPRQSGLIDELTGIVIFEPKYRDSNALNGITDYSHLWLIWIFSENFGKNSPTVRPPRLGGNKRMGVFATRSPFRPNNIGLSSVKLIGVERTKEYGTVLKVSGADLLDGTPIVDIKPYLPFTDCHPNALGGFADRVKDYSLNVEIPDEWKAKIPEEKRNAIEKILAGDPRPSYQNDENRVYGLSFAGFDIKFRVLKDRLIVTDIIKGQEN